MGMGFAANSGMAIKYDDLKELCPQEIAAIESHESFEDWGSLARGLWLDEENFKDFVPLVKKLEKSFKAATTTKSSNLKLYLTYYDEENGDRYDEVVHSDGCIFEVDNVYQLTPAGKKFKEKLHRNNFVTFG
jgi:hypothetical protein